MTIKITTSDLINNIKSKSHREVASIQDEKLRYMVEAGSEKESEIKTCISEALASFESGMFRFVQAVENDTATASNTLGTELSFELLGGRRRLMGKQTSIANLLMSFITNVALSRFYASVNHPELSAKRKELSSEDAILLDKFLFEKRPPRV